MSDDVRFFFQNRAECPVKAAGVVLRRIGADGEPQFLMQIRRYIRCSSVSEVSDVSDDKKWFPRWIPRRERNAPFVEVVEDFGGKVDARDTSIIDIMTRECEEESNGVIDPTSVADRLSHRFTRFYYCRKGKYALAVIPATREECALTSADFGDREEHDEYLILRRVQWLSAREIFARRSADEESRYLHCRITFPHAFR